jgi:hypothetical protein
MAALALLILAPLPAASQADPGVVQHRNDCRLAEQILTQGQPAGKRSWALEIIGSCPEAEALLVSLWSALPVDEQETEALYHLSVQAKTPAAFYEGLTAARNPGAPALVRLAGLGTAVTYVHPDVILYLAERRPLEGLPPLEWDNVWGRLDHPLHGAGDVALPPGARDEVEDLVSALRDDPDVDSLLRDAAFWLSDLLGHGDPLGGNGLSEPASG